MLEQFFRSRLATYDKSKIFQQICLKFLRQDCFNNGLFSKSILHDIPDIIRSSPINVTSLEYSLLYYRKCIAAFEKTDYRTQRATRQLLAIYETLKDVEEMKTMLEQVRHELEQNSLLDRFLLYLEKCRIGEEEQAHKPLILGSDWQAQISLMVENEEQTQIALIIEKEEQAQMPLVVENEEREQMSLTIESEEQAQMSLMIESEEQAQILLNL